MRHVTIRMLAVSSLLVGVVPPVGAVSLDVANRVISRFAELQRPTRASSDFDRWTYNTTLFTAIGCWYEAAHGQENSFLHHQHTVGGGMFTMPKPNEIEPLCQSVASHGIWPICTASTVSVPPVAQQNGLPHHMLLVSLDVAMNFTPIKIEGVLHCYLNKDQVQEQDFVTPLTAVWVEKNTRKKTVLPSGWHLLKVGRILIKAPSARGLKGEPYAESRDAVIQN